MVTAATVLAMALAMWAPTGARAQQVEAGRAAITRYGCVNCHVIPGFQADAQEDCVACHQELLNRPRSGLGAAPRVVHYLQAPDLSRITHRLRPEYLSRYIVDPHDARPRIEETMPRLPVTGEDAQVMVAYLTSVAGRPPAHRGSPAPDPARVARGAQVFSSAGCHACHTFGNHRPSYEMPTAAVLALGAPAQWAPNLRFVRERLDPDVALAWIRNPSSVDPETSMPTPQLSENDALAVRDFLFLGNAGPAVSVASVPRASGLVPLERRVRFANVRRIFGRSCIHCHAHTTDSAAATGLGFDPTALDLSTHQGLVSGTRLPDGTRRSVLVAEGEGTPPLLARLLRRHAEASRDAVPERQDTLIPGVRAQRDQGPVGMPLGLPPVSRADITIIATWIAQGAPP